MSDSYYNRPWRGHVEVSEDSFVHVSVLSDITSVEQGLAQVKRSGILDLSWRIVDTSGNVYESGRFPLSVNYGELGLTDIEKMTSAEYQAALDAEAHDVEYADGTVADFKTIEDLALEMGGNAPRSFSEQAQAYYNLTRISKGREPIHILESERRARLEASMREEKDA